MFWISPLIFNSRKKSAELGGIKSIIRPHTAAQVKAERFNRSDGVGDIGRGKTARQKKRDANGVADTAAQSPIVCASRAAEFLDGETQVAGVEQERIHMSRRSDGVIYRRGIGHMHDLNERDAWQFITKPGINRGGQMVAKLKRVRAAATLLRGDGFRRAFAGEKESGNRRRHSFGNPRNYFFRDNARSAGHGGNQAHRRSPASNGQCSLGGRLDATNFYSWINPHCVFKISD